MSQLITLWLVLCVTIGLRKATWICGFLVLWLVLSMALFEAGGPVIATAVCAVLILIKRALF